MTANDDSPAFAQNLNIGMYANKLRNFQRAQRPFWLFYNQCCGNCEFGGYVENILEDVTNIRKKESEGPHPHITLNRKHGPQIGLYFSDGRPTPADTLAYSTAYGIDLFVLDGTAPPPEAHVLHAHIRPQTCRNNYRKRLRELWDHIDKLLDPRVGIVEDFRSEKRKQTESQEYDKKWEDLEQNISAGLLRCARCGYQFSMSNGGFSYSTIQTHREDGKCGEQTPFCQNCHFEVRSGWSSEIPEDAVSWGLRDDCLSCQEALKRHQAHTDAIPNRPYVQIPTSYGSRLVQGPQRRTQRFVVGERIVTRRELQEVLMTFKYLLLVVLPDLMIDKAISQTTQRQLNHLDEIQDAILYRNGILQWDWLKSLEDKVVPDNPYDTGSKQDRFFFPKRWWTELPPFPIDFIPSLRYRE